MSSATPVNRNFPRLVRACLPWAASHSPISAAPMRSSLHSASPYPSLKSATFHSSTRRFQVYKASRDVDERRRQFSTTAATRHGHWEPPSPGEEVYVTFVDKDGVEEKIAVNKGDNLLTIAQANDIEMEGACEGSCSCSTCHVIVEDDEMFDRIPEATDEENDMLDLAFGLTETSRLGCQIVMTKELDGLRVRLPSMTRNLQASDFSKKS